MALTDADIIQIRELIQDELRLAHLPHAITFIGEGIEVTSLKLPENTIYSSNDFLTRDVMNHIEMTIITRLIHYIMTGRAQESQKW